jgi:hypothetical protein
MNVQLDAFEMFWKQWFVSEQGHFRAGFQTFTRPDEFEHLLEGHVRAWLDERGLLGKEVIWRIAERGSPFRGLEPYEPRHADVFFGRAPEIDRARDRLLAAAAGGTAFLLVMGASGSGKSSLVRAGLVTRLTEPGDIDGVDAVRFAVMRPGSAATPQRALAEALFRSEALLLATTLGADASAAALPILGALNRSADGAKDARGDGAPHPRPGRSRRRPAGIKHRARAGRAGQPGMDVHPVLGNVPEAWVDRTGGRLRPQGDRYLRGSAPALNDMLGGQVDVMADTLLATVSHIRAGKLKLLAVGSSRRLDAFPQVQTVAEVVPGFGAVTWMAIGAPPGTRKDVTKKLSDAIAQAMHMPDVNARIAELEAEPYGSTPDEMADLVRQSTERWRPVIVSANITID